MKQPLRIAVVHPFSWPEVRRGGERYLDDLVWYLTEAGHAVDVVTGTTSPSFVAARGGATERRRRNVVPDFFDRTVDSLHGDDDSQNRRHNSKTRQRICNLVRPELFRFE